MLFVALLIIFCGFPNPGDELLILYVTNGIFFLKSNSNDHIKFRIFLILKVGPIYGLFSVPLNAKLVSANE